MRGSDTTLIGSSARGVRYARWILGLLAFCTGIALLFATKPWELAIPAEIAKGIRPSLDAFVADGLWNAGAINGVLLVLMAATAHWWLAPLPAQEASALPRIPRWFYPAMLLMLLLAIWFRAPRLDHSLWNDEEYTLRRYAWGACKIEKNGEAKFHKHTWQTTFWDDRGANNHVLFSLTARTSLNVWQTFGQTKSRFFSETALRLPALIASLLSLAALSFLLAQEGRPLVGIGASLLLALHPWHIRYSVEARGYAFVLLFVTVGIWMLLRAMRIGQWRWWSAYAVCQFFYLYSFPGAVYLAAALNAGAFLLLLRRPLQLARLTAACIFSAMAFLQLMGPCFRQIKLYLARDISQGTMGSGWFLDIWSHLVAGVRWVILDPGNPHIVSGQSLFETYWLFKIMAACVLPALLVIGLIRARPRFPVIAAFAAAILAFLHTRSSGNFLFSWYLLYLLPCFAIALVSAIYWPKRQLWSVGLLALFLACYATATNAARQKIVHTPRQPLRETIATAREGMSPMLPEGDKVMTASFGTSSGQLRSYDPRITVLDGGDDAANARELQQLVATAHEQGKALWVICGGPGKAAKEDQLLTAMVHDPAMFSEVHRMDGLEEMFSLRIYRLQSKAQ